MDHFVDRDHVRDGKPIYWPEPPEWTTWVHGFRTGVICVSSNIYIETESRISGTH